MAYQSAATTPYPPEDIRRDREACAIYEEMSMERESTLTRARVASELTIPTLFPPPGITKDQDLEDPYQDTGAIVTNGLASVFTLASFPNDTDVFQMEAEPRLATAMEEDPQLGDKVEKSFALYAKQIMDEVEDTGLRPLYYQTQRHKIVGGNCLLNIPVKGAIRYFGLDSYCQEFDGSGNLIRLAICQYFSKTALPRTFYEALQRWQGRHGKSDTKTYFASGIPGAGNVGPGYTSSIAMNRPSDIPVFTIVQRELDDDEDGDTAKFHVWQEVYGEPVEKRYRQYDKIDLPYVPMLYNEVSGESYARGRISEHFGRLAMLEGFTQGAFEIMAAMAKLLIFVGSDAGIDRKKVERAASGAILTGDVNKIGALRIDKGGDLNFIVQMLEKMDAQYRRDVGLEFVPRQGERVTAEEIQMMRREADKVSGGAYSIAAYREHRPIFYLYMNRIEARGEAPVVNVRPEHRSLVRPRIITGIEASGRADRASRARQLMADLALLGPGGAAIPKLREVAGLFASASGFSPSQLLKSREELDALEKQIQQAQFNQQLGSKAIDVIGNAAESHLSAGAPNAAA